MKTSDQGLSKRELQIIQLISEGFTTAEIAVKLNLSNETIRKQRKNVLQKLKLKNTALLMRYVFENNLVK